MKISVIVPTYNEAENIKKLVPMIDSVLKDYDYEIIVVDDNSPDGTAEVAKKLAEQYPVKVLVRKKKLGLASAILYGFMNANGDVLGVIDADLQHPPELLGKMAKKIKDGYDIVIASRYVEEGGTEGWPFHRWLISKVAILLARPLTNVKDPMSGCFLLKRKVIEGINFSPIGCLLLEILAKGNYGKIVELPYAFRGRIHSESRLNGEGMIKYIRLLLHLYFHKLKLYNIFRHFSIMFFAIISSYIFAYVFHMYMARNLGTYGYGILGALLSLYYILSVPIGTIQTTVAKYISELKAKEEYGKIKFVMLSSVKVTGILGLILFLFMLVVSPFISQFLRISSIYIIFLSISASLYFLLPALRGVLQGLEKFEWLGMNVLMEKILLLTFGIAFVHLGLGVSGAILSYGAATGIVALLALYPLFWLNKFENVKCQVEYFYALPVLITFTCITVMSSVDVMIVKHKFTSDITGKYTAISMLGKVIYFASLALAGVMFPKSSSLYTINNSAHKGVLRLSVVIVTVLCVAIILIYSLFPFFILSMLFGKEYIEMAGLLKFYGLAMGLLSISIVIMFYLLSINSSRFVKYLLGLTILEVLLLELIADSIISVVYLLIAVSSALLIVVLINTKYR